MVVQLEYIDEEIQSSLASVANLSDVVVELIADAMGLEVRQLRHESIVASSVQAAYIGIALRRAREHPWSLAAGDISANLYTLKAGPCPADPVSCRIWHLMQLGVCREEVVAGLRLFLDAPWSSEAVEQGHAAASRLIRRHKDLGVKSCMARSLVMHMIPLCADVPDVNKKAKLEGRLQRFHSVQVDRITGRHAYFADMQKMDKVTRDLRKNIAIDFGKKKNKTAWHALQRSVRGSSCKFR